MAEIDAIKSSANGPVIEATLVDDLTRIGVSSGMTLIVHSSLSSMGWVCGGAVAVIHALETVLGETGEEWENPPVDDSWWQTIRDTMPPFDAGMTPTRGMGTIPECFRGQTGVLRSQHPQLSFAAWGKYAGLIVRGHSLSYGLGEESPLAKIYELGGSVLLMGVGYDSNTSMHLAECRANYATKTVKCCEAPITENGRRKWVSFEDVDGNSEDFSEIGKAYEASGGVFSKGKLGYAESILIPHQKIVDFATEWIEKYRI
ncbi:MAG: AAC(3) family N-acetyltransferase [Planctomycetota bacterium]|jgi:aminoglycoside 3-N-acetyltransferase